MNVEEVLKIKSDRRNRNKKHVHKIIEHIHNKIKYYAGLNKDSCSYIVPPIVDNMPLFNIEDVVNDIFKILDSEGYIVSAYSNGQVDICWNEKLVQQKVKSDAWLISQEQRKMKNITKKAKKVDERFSFLANPKKTSGKPKTADEQLDEEVEKILKEKETLQKRYKSMVN